MSIKKRAVLFLGSNGFPIGMAAIQRQIQLAKTFKLAGFEVTVLNWKGVHSRDRIKMEKIQSVGYFEEIKYLYTSGVPRYYHNFLLRNLLKVIGRIGELAVILKYNLTKNVNSFVVNCLELNELRYYYFIARILGVEVIYDYVEFVSSLGHRDMNDLPTNSFDYKFVKFADKFICISPFLESHLNSVAPNKSKLLIPPIIDFDYVASIKTTPSEKRYFLFCGSTAYRDIFHFVIQAFKKCSFKSGEFELYLVINGDAEIVKEIKKITSENSSITTFSDLRYDQLLALYKNALALLIPMSENLQDRARFPFKICEYTSAARPIITTAGGPIPFYFTNMVNAVISYKDDLSAFADGMQFIAAHPEKATEIGNAGYQLGRKVFNLSVYSDQVLSLVNNSQLK
jgi:glycosyltransferase involved in cell wall biosynthesis